MINRELISDSLKRYLRYANPTTNNFALDFFYALAYPTAILLAKLRVKPNTVTTFSVLLVIAAIIFLHLGKPSIYVLLWLTAHYLDFVDGTLARMTKQARSNEFRVDHYSDILKVLMTFLAVGFYYDKTIFWASTFLAMSLFLVSNLLNHDVGAINRLQSNISGKREGLTCQSGRDFLRHKKRPPLETQIKQALTTINGHTLFLFPFAVISYEYALLLYIYFGSLAIYQGFDRIRRLQKTKRLS